MSPKRRNLLRKTLNDLVEIVFESIIETLNQGEKIELRGFGSFRVRERGARRGRNPKTGDPVSIPAKRVPYFKPGKELKELINDDNSSARRTSGTLHRSRCRRHPAAAHSVSHSVEDTKLDRLWSPWRSKYIASAGDSRTQRLCVLLNLRDDPDNDEANFVVHRAAHNFIVLNLYPYISGHL